MTIKEMKILILIAARHAVNEMIINGNSHFVRKDIDGQYHSVEYLRVYDYLTELIQREEDIE